MEALWNRVALYGAAAVAITTAQVWADTPKPQGRAASAPPEGGMVLLAQVQLSQHGGIGFDDLLYTPALDRVLAPAGNMDALELIDPSTRMVTPFKNSPHASQPFRGRHDDGMTSADADGEWAFAIDRTSKSLLTFSAKQGTLVSRIGLSAGPDYVRYVASTQELWVTEPGKEQIEVFEAPRAALAKTGPTRLATISVAGGPESLVIDQQRHCAYAHLWKGKTVVIDIGTRKILRTYLNGCQGSRGIALDTEKRFVFAGCSEGRVAVLDEKQAGKVVASASTSAGVDIIAYNPQLRHLYAPGASDGQMSVFSVASSGILHELGRAPTAVGAHCVTADHRGQVWVCDPDRGRVLVFKDDYGATPSQ